MASAIVNKKNTYNGNGRSVLLRASLAHFLHIFQMLVMTARDALVMDLHLKALAVETILRETAMPAFNSCTNWFDITGKIHNSTPDCHLVSWSLTSQLRVALMRMLRGSLMCLAYFFWHVIRGCAQQGTGKCPVDFCNVCTVPLVRWLRSGLYRQVILLICDINCIFQKFMVWFHWQEVSLLSVVRSRFC